MKKRFEKRLKKYISVVLVLTLAASLCMGCGNKEVEDKAQITTECIAETPTEQPVEIVEKSTEKVAEEITTEIKEARNTETEEAVAEENTNIKNTTETDTTEESASEEVSENKTVVVCIDPGHGGEGDNNHGVEREYNGVMVMEKSLTLALAQKIGWCLQQQPGVAVVLTRTGDYAMGISDRVNCAVANNADILVSIHINSSSTGNPDDNGCLAIVTQSHYQPSGAKSADVYGSSQALAANILANLNGVGIPFTADFNANATGGLLRRTSESGATYADGSVADYYGIISHATKAGIPACIVEHAFLSNENDYWNYLSDDTKLDTLAKADADGIMSYINANY